MRHSAPAGHRPAVDAARDDAAAHGVRRWWVLALLSLAQFMVILDVTVVNVALPVIADQLDLSRTALTWVVTAYTLCFGGLLLLGGRLADVLGRRPTFLTGLAVFTIASLGSGLAGDATMLVLARATQGVGAALLSPSALSIITTSFHGQDRTRALGVWAALGGAGAAIGVLLGGLFTAGPGWEWVFFINVPVGVFVALALPMAISSHPSPARRPTGRIDIPGALLATLAVGSLIYGLVRAGDAGWDEGGTLLALAAAAALLLAFALIERTTPTPLVRPAVLARRAVAAGNLVMLASSGLLLANFFLSSQYLQHVLGLGSLATGLTFLPAALVIGVGTHLGARVVGGLGGRPAAVAGFLLAAAGALLLARLPADGNALVHVLPGLAISGLGLGATFVTATTTAMAQVDPHDAGMASGFITTGHELGATLGVAFVSSVAGASLSRGTGPVPMDGFGAAFTAAAVVALVMAAVAGWLVPAGRPPATGGRLSAH
jgi:EmrB/QacA subfamily drug resistance transporter